MKYLKASIWSILLIFFDQWTKYAALTKIKPISKLSIVEGVLSLTYHENRGAVWGIMQGQIPILIVTTIIILAVVLFVFTKIPETKKYVWLRIVSILLVSGAIGNFIDRVFRQYVVDFIYFELIDFPIFNVADIYVCAAAGLLILVSLLVYKEDSDFDFLCIKKGEKDDSMDCRQ